MNGLPLGPDLRPVGALDEDSPGDEHGTPCREYDEHHRRKHLTPFEREYPDNDAPEKGEDADKGHDEGTIDERYQHLEAPGFSGVIGARWDRILRLTIFASQTGHCR